jgi:hypothetical protein
MKNPLHLERRHFAFVAQVIAALDLTDDCQELVATSFARALKNTNGRFNEPRFLEAARKE